jgi:hypothetical protein
MRNLGSYLLVLCLAMASGCASQIKPIIDYDPSGNFASYKRFSFISEHPMILSQGVAGVSPLAEGRIMAAIEDVLIGRGYTRVADPESADFAVSFTLGSRDQVRVDSYPEPYRGGYGTWGRGWGGGYYGYGQSVNVSSYTEGILSIDLYDVKEHRPVWHGRATKKITTKVTDNPVPVINEVVLAIMSRFPPL